MAKDFVWFTAICNLAYVVPMLIVFTLSFVTQEARITFEAVLLLKFVVIC